jgi:8-oxo-dGTP pyrophosphatase MutT (NUDIX family)
MADHTNRVAAVVIPRTPEKEEYLVAKRADNGEWEFPGGKEDLNEDKTILDTAEREISEELNLEIEAKKYREKHSYTIGGYDIIPVYAQHSYSNPDRHIEMTDHTDYKWINSENPEMELGKEIKCLEAFNIL